LQRKLTAILCADVHGYSRLMGADEEATLGTLSAYRKILDGLIEQHRGRFVNSAGDSVLAEFTSVVEAVNCAVKIQNTLKAENAGLPLESRMEFRIGVNLGDVMIEGEQIYGDGVNVAARLESLADPGGICISGTVYEQVRDKLALSYEDRGEQSVKNIARPVHVWRVVPGGTPTSARLAAKYWRRGALSLTGIAIAVGSFVLVQHLSLKPPHTSASVPPTEKPALSLPSIPSIAVLPFTNLSGDPQQDYFSDGITDDLITDLSRIPNLFVISRSSSFTYKGKAEKAPTIGRELGVKYLLEGSVRKSTDELRLNAQLVDAATGNEVWVQRYDRPMRDIFKLQDEIVRSLAATVKLELGLLGRGYDFAPQRTNNLEAYDYFLRGFETWFRTATGGFAQARKMLEKSIELDPGYADPYAYLGFWDWLEYVWQRDNNASALNRALERANKSISLDDSNSLAYTVRAWVAAMQDKREQALLDAGQATSVEPNSAFAWMARADINNALVGKPEETLTYVQKARRLDPRHPEIGCQQEGWAYNIMGRYAQAVEALKECEDTNISWQNSGGPYNPYTHVALVFAYSELGRQREAHDEAAEVQRVSPGFSLGEWQRRSSGMNWQEPKGQYLLSVLRKAGLK
jgi:adenylate cyclase